MRNAYSYRAITGTRRKSEFVEVRNINALFVIDVQEEYMIQYNGSLLTAINRRIDESVKKNELIVYVKNVRHLKSGTFIYEFADGLNVCSSHVAYKEQASVFSNDALLMLLRENNVSKIDIIGIDGCCCVARTAADARTLGFEVTLPCSCIGVKNNERFENKKTFLIKQGVCFTE